MKMISVVMPVFNCNEDHFIEAVKSVLSQSYSDFEFIVVFDGDQELKRILKTFDDKRIIIITNDRNMGVSYSLNKGVRYASGKYIFRMDSDDISMPERFFRQLKKLEEGYDLVSSRCIVIDENGEYLHKSRRYPKHNFVRWFVFFYILKKNVVVHSSVAGLRDIFIKNPYDETVKYAQDAELWFRLSSIHRFYFMNELLVKYRSHAHSFEKSEYQSNVMKKIRKGSKKL